MVVLTMKDRILERLIDFLKSLQTKPKLIINNPSLEEVFQIDWM